MAESAPVVRVDIVERGRALIDGPGFTGYTAVRPGPRSSTGRPTSVIMLADDTDDGDRPPLPALTRSLRKGFPAAARDMARTLADHYGVTDPTVALDDETHSYTLPED